jgi:hypothetical protein
MTCHEPNNCRSPVRHTKQRWTTCFDVGPIRMHPRPNAACTTTATTRNILAVDLGKHKVLPASTGSD